MNYSEALDYVHAIPKFVRPLGNLKLSGLLMLLGNPQDKLKFVHIAGTNGKGSVCSMTAEILKCAGYKTGLFTSPFIMVFNERIQINGTMIADSELAEYVSDIAQLMYDNDIEVSEFAFITALALKYFADNDCDIVVLETGMGGRLDATNIIPTPICCAITSISLDHTQYLGDTLDKITLEKCGIIKDNGSVVAAPNTDVCEIIRSESQKHNAKLVLCEKSHKTANGFTYKDTEYDLGLKGEYQAENGAVVIEIINALRVNGYTIPDTALCQGLANAKWQARYEFVRDDIVIDGGHNIDGIRQLKKSLIAENRPIVLLMAMMSDKDYKDCISEISGIAECVVATELDIPRALKATELKTVFDDCGTDCIAKSDINEAFQTALELKKDGLLCVCGSLYLAGEAKRAINELDKSKEI